MNHPMPFEHFEHRLIRWLTIQGLWGGCRIVKSRYGENFELMPSDAAFEEFMGYGAKFELGFRGTSLAEFVEANGWLIGGCWDTPWYFWPNPAIEHSQTETDRGEAT